MVKTPQQVLERIKKRFEKTKDKWNKHLTGEEKDYILSKEEGIRPKLHDEIKKVLILLDKALFAANKIESWRNFYEEWNGNSDISRANYNGKKDLGGRLSDLRLFLEEWEAVSYQQKLRNLLQVLGIDPEDDNAQQKTKELKEFIDDAEINQKNIELLRRRLISIEGEEQWKKLILVKKG